MTTLNLYGIEGTWRYIAPVGGFACESDRGVVVVPTHYDTTAKRWDTERHEVTRGAQLSKVIGRGFRLQTKEEVEAEDELSAEIERSRLQAVDRMEGGPDWPGDWPEGYDGYADD